MYSKLIFLDFDGTYWPRSSENPKLYSEFAQFVLKDPAIGIVISSNWRLTHGLEDLRGYFHPDIEPRIIGTIALEDDRDFEVRQKLIEQYVSKYKEELRKNHVKRQLKFVALDDNDTLFKPNWEHLIVCKYSEGMTLETLEEIKKRFESIELENTAQVQEFELASHKAIYKTHTTSNISDALKSEKETTPLGAKIVVTILGSIVALAGIGMLWYELKELIALHEKVLLEEVVKTTVRYPSSLIFSLVPLTLSWFILGKLAKPCDKGMPYNKIQRYAMNTTIALILLALVSMGIAQSLLFSTMKSYGYQECPAERQIQGKATIYTFLPNKIDCKWSLEKAQDVPPLTKSHTAVLEKNQEAQN